MSTLQNDELNPFRVPTGEQSIEGRVAMDILPNVKRATAVHQAARRPARGKSLTLSLIAAVVVGALAAWFLV